MILIGPSNLWFGLPEQMKLMIDCIPPGARIRYRFRNEDWPRVYIKTPNEIREFIVVNRTPEYWGFDYEQRRNVRL